MSLTWEHVVLSISRDLPTNWKDSIIVKQVVAVLAVFTVQTYFLFNIQLNYLPSTSSICRHGVEVTLPSFIEVNTSSREVTFLPCIQINIPGVAGDTNIKSERHGETEPCWSCEETSGCEGRREGRGRLKNFFASNQLSYEEAKKIAFQGWCGPTEEDQVDFLKS